MSKPSFDSVRDKYIKDEGKKDEGKKDEGKKVENEVLQDTTDSQDDNICKSVKLSNNLGIIKKETNILDQMISYEPIETDNFINNLKNNIDNQEKINNILKTTNYEDNKEDIEKFINDNKDNIHTQLSTLEKMFSKIKNLINDNEKMKNNQPEYKELGEKDETKELINDMTKLKLLKESINFFLLKNGVDVFI